jgi:hypothetical protein
MMQKAAVSTGKILLFFVLMALFLAGSGVAMGALGMRVDANPMTGTAGLAMAALSVVSMFVPATLLNLAFDGKSPMAMGLQPGSAIADFLSGGLVGGFILVAALAGAFVAGFARFEPGLAGFSMQAFALSAGVMTLYAAAEEVMMRGYILQELMTKFSTAASVVVSSLIFVALHASALIESSTGAIGAVNIFLASVLMSLAYLKTRALWLPIGLHAGWNVAQGPLLGLNVSGFDLEVGWQPVVLQGPDMMTGARFGFEGSVLAMAGPLLGILMMLSMRRRT